MMHNNIFKSKCEDKLKYIRWVFWLKVLLFFGGQLLLAQSYFQGPASGSVPGGVSTSTALFSGRVLGPVLPRPSTEIRNEELEPLVSDEFNSVLPSAPLRSNEVVDANAKAISLIDSSPKGPGIIIDFEGIPQTGFIPPDPILAVGPDHIVAAVNARFAIFDKQGNKLFEVTAQNWFSNVVPGATRSPFDPQVIYDHYAKRWVQVWVGLNLNYTEPYYLISVSDDNNPLGTWCNYALPGDRNGSTLTLNWNDYPKMGFDSLAIYISANMFFPNSGPFDYAKIRIIPKSGLYDTNCGPVTWTDFWDLRDPDNFQKHPFALPIPAISFGATNVHYLLGDSPFETGTFVTLWSISDPVNAPTLSAVNLPVTASYALWPPGAQQLGGGAYPIEVFGRVFKNPPILRDGYLWAAHDVAGGTGFQFGFARYLRIRLNLTSVIEDVAFGADDYWHFFPGVMVDENHNLTMVFSRSGFSEYVGARYTGRFDTDPPGLAPSALLKKGEGNYVVTGSSTRNRWGDYMGITLDPSDPNVIWSIVEYAAGTNTWGTWIGSYTHSYTASGIVQDAATGDPIQFANVEINETGQTIETDSVGFYSFGSLQPTVTVHTSAFAYQDTTIALTLTPYVPEVLDILMQPQIEATISGQVRDPATGNGIVAELEFYAEGNPYPGPYVTATTDANGNYNVTTIIGNYNILVYPETPYPFAEVENVVLGVGGLTQNIELNPADVLLVDGDENNSYDDYYTAALKNTSKSYHLWDVQADGVPTAAQMAEYPSGIILWYTGDSDGNAISQAARDELLAHLNNNNGKVFLTGQDIAEETNGSPLLNSLGLAFAQNSTTTVIVGTAGNIGDGLVFLTSGTGGAGNQTSRDQLSITDSSTTQTAFTYSTVASAIAGVTYASGSKKAVFLGFGWEAINDVAKRETLLENVIEYLEGPTGIDVVTATPLPAEFELAQNYPNPFNPITYIRYALPKAMHVRLEIYNTLGERVVVLENERKPAGFHLVEFDANQFAGGLYFYRINAGRFNAVKKMLLLK